MSSETPDSGRDQSMLPLDPDRPAEDAESTTSAQAPPDDPDREAHSTDAPPDPEVPSNARPRTRPASISDDLITVEDHLERILRVARPAAP